MGQAILKGWLNNGLPYPISIIDPKFECDFLEVLQENRVLVNPRTPEKCDILFIGIKPQTFKEIVSEISGFCHSDTLIVSIMAGINVASLSALGAKRIFRVMPNTPGQIGEGISGLFGNEFCLESDYAIANELLAPLGEIVRLHNESEIDMVTAVSGSGPAYVFLLAEAMAKAGEKIGLEAQIAHKLALSTINGAAQLMLKSNETPAVLRKNVTSPNGTTQAALEVLMKEQGIEYLLEKAIIAAFERAKELSKS